MRMTFAVAAAAGVTLAAALATSAALPLTPDQRLVAGLETASTASRAALRSLSQASPPDGISATDDLMRASRAIDAATKVAPLAVGALETSSVRTALRRARIIGRQTKTDIATSRYAAARAKIRRALALEAAALEDFGMPLEKQFAAFAVDRDFRNVPGFEGYSGFSATVGTEVKEVVIGPPDRTTANAGEAGATTGESPGLPITAMSAYILSDPIGRFTSGWCNLDAGLITCRIRPAMPADNIFTIAFGPKLPKGTKLLVKFRSETGDRSYAVFTTR